MTDSMTDPIKRSCDNACHRNKAPPIHWQLGTQTIMEILGFLVDLFGKGAHLLAAGSAYASTEHR
ncbi:hypothetical protein Ntsu_62960 [Nocardia sp. IFM 10818]